MSGYGLKITNPSGGLVLSSGARGLTCIGKGVLQGVTQVSGSGTAASPGRTWGFSTYRVSHPGPVMWAVDLPANKYVGVASVSQPSPGVWQITCHCGDALDTYGFATNQYPVDVWAFGYVSNVLESYGLALYDAAGQLAYDLSRPYPFFPRAYIKDTYGSSVSIPALARPVAMGCPGTSQLSQSQVSSNTYAHFMRWGVWLRSGTSLNQVLVTKQRFQYFGTEPRDDSSDDFYHTPSFILEGALLP